MGRTYRSSRERSPCSATRTDRGARRRACTVFSSTCLARQSRSPTPRSPPSTTIFMTWTTTAFVRQRALVQRCRHDRVGRTASASPDARGALAFGAERHRGRLQRCGELDECAEGIAHIGHALALRLAPGWRERLAAGLERACVRGRQHPRAAARPPCSAAGLRSPRGKPGRRSSSRQAHRPQRRASSSRCPAAHTRPAPRSPFSCRNLCS